MRKPYIVGNWKMNLTVDKVVALARDLKQRLAGYTAVEVGVCPVACCIPAAAHELAGSGILVGGQNIHHEPAGAYTGEMSAPILKSAGASIVIIGHSERRQYFGEANDGVRRKIQAALAAGLRPIVCVGERLEEREADRTEYVVRDHVEGALAGLPAEQMPSVTIAYEPVWAIGTGRTATPQQAQEVHAFIRGLLVSMFDGDTAAAVRIQYGGSVRPENARGLMTQPDIDGALVGGASLTADAFVGIVRFAEQ